MVEALQSPLVDESAWRIYKRLMRYTKPFRWGFYVGMVGFLVYAVTQMAWAELFKYITDAIENSDATARHGIALAIVMIFFIRGVGSLIGSYCFAYVARNVVHTMRQEMFQRMLHLSPLYYRQNAQGRLLSKMTYNIEQVATACTDAFKTIVQEGLIVLVLLTYLFISNWKLSLLFFAIGPIIGWSVQLASKRLNQISARIQRSVGDVSHSTSEVINGYQSVKIYSAERNEQERFAAFSRDNYRQSLKLVITQSLHTPVVQCIVASMLAVVVWLALNPQIFGSTTTGEFFAFITAAALLAKPIRQLTQVNTALQNGIAAARSVFELIDFPVESDTQKGSLEQVKGDLVFKNLCFRYSPNETRRTLDGVSFEVQAGQTVAIVGASGSGKTTLVSLLPRFLTPESGVITLDGTPIETLTLSSLRSQISIVNQQVYLFNDSIRHNIAYGELQGRSDEQIWHAIEVANAREFVEQLPHGLDTRVGERGVQLSGGQQQRIALARAVLKDAPILILDEATSALDQATEKLVQTALDRVRKNRTTLVVAHRLSTIQSADKIIVLDQGRVAESGTHETLLAQSGLYANFVRSGLKQEKDRDEPAVVE